MLNRYLGNKKSIIKPLMKEITNNSKPSDLICDAFSGSLAVSFALKKEGYRVACNDVNLFSHFYGKHLIEQCSIPNIAVNDFLSKELSERYKSLSYEWIRLLPKCRENYLFLNRTSNIDPYASVLAVILYLDDVANGMHKVKEKNSYIYDVYTEDGALSKYKSTRGTEGRRKFFRPINGTRIDCILSEIRNWRINGLLGEGYFYFTLICLLMDAVEKISNTQGTYHDFPREKYDSRSNLDLVLVPPDYDGIISKDRNHIIGYCEDSLDFIQRVPKHSILYLDPPYNFRQYTSYYFLPNVLCEYCDMLDINAYFSEVKYVRGQNMSNDFTSQFSKKSMFIQSLYKLVSQSHSEKVLLSYFDGRNHWNNSTNDGDRVGESVLFDFFRSDLFVGGVHCTPIDRLNYQSYGGHKARVVKEFLFLGERSNEPVE